MEDYNDYNYDYDDSDDYDGTDIYVPPPETNPVRSFFQGPLPSSVELNLTLIYDLDLLKQFHGSKENAEDFLRRVVELTRPHLQNHNLKVKIRIKVTFYDNLQGGECYVREGCVFRRNFRKSSFPPSLDTFPKILLFWNTQLYLVHVKRISHHT